MKRTLMAIALVLIANGFLKASPLEDSSSLLIQADAAYAKRSDVTQAKIALITYEKAAAQDPKNALEAYWKASRAAWWLGEHEDKRSDRLVDYQRGMDNAQRALALRSETVEAHFWLGANQGSYGDTKGVMKSLSMVKPIRHEMAEVIRLDERYNGGGAYHILGVVDYKVPGMMGGNKKRAKEELEKALSISPNDPVHHYYMAEYAKITGDKARLQSELKALRTLQPPPDLVPETEMLQKRAERELQ